MAFQKVNNSTGWAICLIACVVYTMTMEATASLWDCGEFISCSYKLQIPHPPGAPLFVLLGRIFIVCFGWLFGDHPESPARVINLLSALCSGLTILFLFWSITHFARKIIRKGSDTLTRQQLFAIMSAGAVGALAYAFSDSFWFSAVEGEVYSMSSLFTAIVFWSMLKWEHKADEPSADTWIVFIFFMMGLSIGVHLLNLLTIPALVMIYYFKRYKTTPWGTIGAFLTGCVITVFVQMVVIQYTIKWAGIADKWFTDDLQLPAFSGFTAFFLLLAILLWSGLLIARKKKLAFFRLGLLCFSFMLIGYSTYLTTMMRSAANPPIDMNNVDNPTALVSYLGRDQYGESPLYPRMWSSAHTQDYQSWSGLKEGVQPTLFDNISFFLTYQVNWMYWRYFMWNFAGKQNDTQGSGNVRDGNWISGIPLLDKVRLGDQSKLPDSLKDNKAHNALFMLPLLLGIAGAIFHYEKNKKDFLVNLLLFFFTGIAIVVYLNQTPGQARERDYSFAGSFYAFAICIGLGVLQVMEWFGKLMKKRVANYASATLCMLAVPVVMIQQEWDDHDRSQRTIARDSARNYLESCAPNAILYTYGDNDTYPLWYAQEVENIRPDIRVLVHSFLSADWYIDQLRSKMNESDSIDILLSKKQLGKIGSYLPVVPDKNMDQEDYADICELIKAFAGSNATTNYFPARKFSIPVDEIEDRVLSSLKITLPENKNYLYKNELAVYCMIAGAQWKRPVYFTSGHVAKKLGLGAYLRTDGMNTRLVPLEVPEEENIDVDGTLDKLMNKFTFGGADKEDVYFDETNRSSLLAIRIVFSGLAERLNKLGRKEEARKLLEKLDKNILSVNYPYALADGRSTNYVSIRLMEEAYSADAEQLAKKIHDALRKDLEQQIAYYRSLPAIYRPALDREMKRAQQLLSMLKDPEKEDTTNVKH